MLQVLENILSGYIVSKIGLIILNIIYYYLNKTIILFSSSFIIYKLFFGIFEFNDYIKSKFIDNDERIETYILIFSTLFGITIGIAF
jgi:hypothetical protein